jgi:glycosyltransferase involved in cell wall biosynthesis
MRIALISETQPARLLRELAALGHELHWVAVGPDIEARVQRLGVDVVHAHGLSPSTMSALRHAHALGTPTVLSGRAPLDPALRMLLRMISKRNHWPRWADVLTASSSVCAEDLQAATGRTDVRLIPDGIDLDDWRPATRTEPRDSIDIVSVLGLTRRERPLALAGILRPLLRRHPKLRVTIVGDGPQHQAVVRALAGFDGRAFVLGAAPPVIVREVLAAADIFVSPARKDGFSLPVLKARAAGLAVLAMRGSGAADLVEHGQNGLLADDDAQLARSLEILCVAAEERRAMGVRAAVGLEKFSWPSVAAQVAAAYKAAVAARANPDRMAA